MFVGCNSQLHWQSKHPCRKLDKAVSMVCVKVLRRNGGTISCGLGSGVEVKGRTFPEIIRHLFQTFANPLPRSFAQCQPWWVSLSQPPDLDTDLSDSMLSSFSPTKTERHGKSFSCGPVWLPWPPQSLPPSWQVARTPEKQQLKTCFLSFETMRLCVVFQSSNLFVETVTISASFILVSNRFHSFGVRSMNKLAISTDIKTLGNDVCKINQ